MSLRRLRDYVRGVERSSEEFQKRVRENGAEGDFVARFPSVILVLPGMLVSGSVVSGRSYNKIQRDYIEEAQRESFEEVLEEEQVTIGEALKRLFREPNSDEIETIQEDDYGPQTIYLVDVNVVAGDSVTELSELEVADRVQGWTMGQLSR